MTTRTTHAGLTVAAASAVTCLLALAGGGRAPLHAAQPSVTAAAASAERALLDQYCVTCHNARLRRGGLALDQADVDRVSASPEIWEKVLRKLRTGEMPPAGARRPDSSATSALAAVLERSLDEAARNAPNPGRPAIHRLNRAEYANAVRDLLAVPIDTRALLPGDDADHGFDNMAGVLSVSPMLLERYMSAARKISRLAIGDPSTSAGFTTYSIPKLLFQDDRMSEELPFGSRGGAAIEHLFPLDANYTVKLRLRRNLYDYIRGLRRPHQLEVRLDGERVKVFTVGGGTTAKPAPTTYAGNIAGDDEWEQYTHHADEGLEATFPVKAGTHVVGVAFVQDFFVPEGVLQPRPTGFGFSINEFWDGEPSLESIAIGGPYTPSGPGDTPSRRRILTCQPRTETDETCARQILSGLARRAFRRAVSNDDIEPLLTFYRSGQERGFEAGIQAALERLLADPEFLFRIERDPPRAAPGSIYRTSDVELASRLSFFLWSSIPDDELLDLAIGGKLRDRQVLAGQVRRMLADPRSHAMVENFAAQWLSLRQLGGVTPDPDLFPEFDENLRLALARETELFIDSVRKDDRSIVDLLDADYTFVNERLARHYGIPNVYGNRFRKVALPAGGRRGLLGHGSVLTVTSYANRTSPVLRGKWLLDNVLGGPPPPPPPDVPSLRDTAANGKPASVRARLEEHRKNPACAVCHVRMDPLGFALENFDAVGRWRTVDEGGTSIDAAGSLPDGTALDGPIGLRRLIVSHRQEFVETFAEKLLTYALGRAVDYRDLPVVRHIARTAAAADHRWSALVLAIVESTPFQMRRTES